MFIPRKYFYYAEITHPVSGNIRNHNTRDASLSILEILSWMRNPILIPSTPSPGHHSNEFKNYLQHVSIVLRITIKGLCTRSYKYFWVSLHTIDLYVLYDNY